MGRVFIMTMVLFGAVSHFTPARAQLHDANGNLPSASQFVGAYDPSRFGGCGDGHRQQVRRDSRFACGGGSAYADGEWALYNNRSWAADSYNDWWHDRPDRAFPRWVQEQQTRGTCDPSRVWWSGSGWHC
jgi:hypothetical protein